MKRGKSASRAVVIGGIAAIGAIIGFMVLLQAETGRNNEFKRSIDLIATDAIALTREYQAEEAKWVGGQHDNSTMISIVDSYDSRYQELIDRAESLGTPERYMTAKDNLIKAIQAEKESNIHLRNHISTGSPEEYERSIDLVSLSLQYSAEYDAAMKAAG